MTFDDEAFLKDVEAELGRRVEKAAIHVVNTIKENLNQSQPYTISTGDSGKHYHGEDPSAPGEYPKKIRGDLQRSITYQMAPDKQSAQIGTNLDYGAYLELGTSKMQPRPFLRPTIIQEAARIDEIISGGK